MQAVGIYVVINQLRNQERESSSGILKSPEILDRFLTGEVVSCSAIGKEQFGIKEGQRVLFDKNAGHQISSPAGEYHKVVTCNDIAVIL